ncbi:hypothetical protein SLEP1_g38932 [Rubroshorea leprosula]|uniref:Uncharacterized protein n=1 Tax=Rubroshorea leprosula TaxID=152421 RepID=A0AAV5KZC1_9ROSI|nr:hypothetical protein SLEP1_g38932 [Rubroshorea leprosula]
MFSRNSENFDPRFCLCHLIFLHHPRIKVNQINTLQHTKRIIQEVMLK